MQLCRLLETNALGQVKVQRYDVFLTPAVKAGLPAGASEVTLWRVGAGGGGANPKAHPLSLYSVQSIQPIRLGKGMVLPERIAAYEVRDQPCRPAPFPEFAACLSQHQLFCSVALLHLEMHINPFDTQPCHCALPTPKMVQERHETRHALISRAGPCDFFRLHFCSQVCHIPFSRHGGHAVTVADFCCAGLLCLHAHRMPVSGRVCLIAELTPCAEKPSPPPHARCSAGKAFLSSTGKDRTLGGHWS